MNEVSHLSLKLKPIDNERTDWCQRRFENDVLAVFLYDKEMDKPSSPLFHFFVYRYGFPLK